MIIAMWILINPIHVQVILVDKQAVNAEASSFILGNFRYFIESYG